ncbi:MAG: dephospho-CoA kinase [Chloroflexi bacterium]|nr:dephospho-CoA kinase [Chloroflexota bacterium]
MIGLTGSIGTGKSEVARLLESLGAELINADLVGHEAYAPNTEGWRQVVEAFGRDILQPSGEVDRRKLGAIVFSDPEQMAKLNAIMHPRIAEMVGERIEKLRDQGKEVVVVEAALLFEAKWDYLVDEVWSTDAPVETVIQRLRDRNGLEEEEVRKRIDSQMDREERLARSDLVVDNSGDVAALEQTVSSLWKIRVNQRTVRR